MISFRVRLALLASALLVSPARKATLVLLAKTDFPALPADLAQLDLRVRFFFVPDLLD